MWEARLYVFLGTRLYPSFGSMMSLNVVVVMMATSTNDDMIAKEGVWGVKEHDHVFFYRDRENIYTSFCWLRMNHSVPFVVLALLVLASSTSRKNPLASLRASFLVRA